MPLFNLGRSRLTAAVYGNFDGVGARVGGNEHTHFNGRHWKTDWQNLFDGASLLLSGSMVQ